ncbi:DUF5050 domain-containing protein [Paenibacillus sp. TRM 82003]|nr:DUF5050 domain-containing protein [Paenibacillus sp. TRM 82003]
MEVRAGLFGKWLIGIILMTGMLAYLSDDAAKAQQIRIVVDGEEVKMNQAPATFDNVTYVPLRGVFERLGVNVSWDAETHTVTAAKGGQRLEYTVGKSYAFLNGEWMRISAPGRNVDGTTMVPLRLIGQSFGADVVWDNGEIRMTSDRLLLESAVSPSVETVSNLVNGGFLVKQGDWLYGVESVLNGSLYKIKADGTGKLLLLPKEKVSSLAVQGDWLYFVSEGNVYKLKTDGTARTQLTSDGNTRLAYLLNDWLLYNGDGGLFRVRIDQPAATPMRVIEAGEYQQISEFSISDGWVYYRSYDRGERKNTMGRARIDGTEHSTYGNEEFGSLIPHGDDLYFVLYEERKRSIARMPVQGGAIETLVENADDYSISNGRLYYLKHTTLYEADLDGKNARKSVELNEWSMPGHFILLDGLLYYEDNAASIYGAEIKKEIYSVDLATNVTRSLFGKTVHKSYADAIVSDRYGQSYTFYSPRSSEIYEAAKKVVEETVRPEMTEREKVKALHDYVVLNTAYDYENYLNDAIPSESYTEYGILILGTGVCQGYAVTMQLLLDMIGVENYYLSGTAGGGGHAWNIVVLDGTYYHLDATWNDPVPNRAGYVRYDYFLISDEAMAKDHYWDREEVTRFFAD